MQVSLTGCLAAVVSLGLVLTGQACAEGVQAPFKGLPKIQLDFGLGSQESVWTQSSVSKTEASYTCGGYRLNLKLDRKGKQQLLRFRLEPPAGQTLSVQSYTAKVNLPVTGLYAVMVPNTKPIGKQLEYYHANRKWRENVPVYRCLVPEAFKEKAPPNNEAPLIILVDNKGDNKACIGWALADTAAVLEGSAASDEYILTLTRQMDIPFTGDKLEDALVVDMAGEPWTDIETAYAKTFDQYNGRRHAAPPKWAYEPSFCTWYCFDEKIDQDLVLKVARKCKEVGIGTFIIDAGWDAKKGVWWGDLDKCAIGDFVASPELFPDLPVLVKQMQDMGLKVILWTAPFWQAKGSQSYQEKTKDWMVCTEDGPDCNLCPRYPGTRQHLFDKFAWVAKTYGIDGMWLDAADGVSTYCTAKHEHIDQSMGKSWVDCMAAVRDGLRSVKPDAITEARIYHANLNSKRALDTVQCGDSPRTYEMIRLANIHLRPWAYDVVLTTDPTFWPKGTDAATVGKHMATVVCSGVPSIAKDFLTATETECRIIKTWLAFYKEHKKTLLNGKFRLFGESVGIPDMLFTGRDEAIVYVKNPKTTDVELPKTVSRIILINCTNTDSINLRIKPLKGAYRIQAFNWDWSQVGLSSLLDADGVLPVSCRIPQGGAAVVEVD